MKKSKYNPFPMKELKKRVGEIKEKPEDGKELSNKLEQEFKDFIMFGKTPYYGNKDFFKDLKYYSMEEFDLTAEEIIKRF